METSMDNHEPHGRTLDYADAILTYLKEHAVATKAELVGLIEREFSRDFGVHDDPESDQARAVHKKIMSDIGHAKAYLTRHNQTITVGELVCIEPTCYGNLATIGDLCKSDDAKEIIEKLLTYAQNGKTEAALSHEG